MHTENLECSITVAIPLITAVILLLAGHSLIHSKAAENSCISHQSTRQDSNISRCLSDNHTVMS